MLNSSRATPVQAHGLAIAIACLAVAGTSAAAQPPNPQDLTQGKWELQLDKSHFCTAPPQKSTREIVDSGWGLISTYWTGIDAKGKPMEVRYVWRYDGQKYPADIGKPANEAITWKLVNPSKVEFTHWSKDNKITQELSRTVSSDAQTMTQTTKFVGGRNGKSECVDTQVFARQ
ncbi:MAG TPA: hypothetical protein VGN07_17045 [Steroidobacteraceae bacterium]|jgi:hypothetical protein